MMTRISASSNRSINKKSSFSAGFTLLEILLVLTIIGMASVLIVPNIGNLESRTFSTQIRQASNLLNYARRTAVVHGQPASIEFYAEREDGLVDSDMVSSRVSVGSWESAGAEIIFIDSTERETVVESKIEITFFPEGGSTGGKLMLVLDERHATIEINPFTGRVFQERVDEEE